MAEGNALYRSTLLSGPEEAEVTRGWSVFSAGAWLAAFLFLLPFGGNGLDWSSGEGWLMGGGMVWPWELV